MFMVNQLIGFGAADSAVPFSLNYVTTFTSTADQTTYTNIANNYSIGASSGRRLVLGITGYRTSGNVSSATVNGNAVTLHATEGTDSGFMCVRIGSILDDSATVSITVVFSASQEGAAVHLFSLLGAGASPTAAPNPVKTAATTATMTMSIPAGGGAVYIVGSERAKGAGFSTATEHYDTTVEAGRYVVAGSKTTVSALTNHAETNTRSASDGLSYVSAAWGPA